MAVACSSKAELYARTNLVLNLKGNLLSLLLSANSSKALVQNDKIEEIYHLENIK